MKVLVLYYSTYGHLHQMAEAMVEGVNSVEHAEAILRRVPETLPEAVLEKMSALDAQKAMADVPVATVEDLTSVDAIIFGSPVPRSACGGYCLEADIVIS